MRRSTRCSRLEQIINNVIKEKVSIKTSDLGYLKYKQLNWYGHVLKLEEERLPRKILGWKKKKRKISKFVGAGSNNRNEREEN